MSDFSVHSLPTSHARIVTDDHNEIHISFEPVKCEVDESDGSFFIHLNHYPARITPPFVKIVETGYVDSAGGYTFSKKSLWAIHTRTLHMKSPDLYYRYVDNTAYFNDNIWDKLNQQKVGICV